MELRYDLWLKSLEKLISKFNNPKTNPVERFAALSAIHDEFKHETEGLEKELQRYKQRAIEEISKA
jgi:aspartate aminotransferase-like enzyme